VADKKFALGDYVEVKDRIGMFYEAHPDGRLVTDRVELWQDDEIPRIVVKALAYRTADDPHPGVGWSWMLLPGSTPYTRGSELENTETSAWGRAIGSLGIGINGGIASAQEVRNKAGEADREPEPETTTHDGGLIGTASVGKGDADFQLREAKDGPRLSFRLVQGRKGLKVLTRGPLAEAVATLRRTMEGQRVTVWGTLHDETFTPAGQTKPITYQVVHAERIATADYVLPAPERATETPAEPIEAPSVPMLPLDDEERELIAGGLK
jgi:hypothetical protein